jgi:hypothetical protein
MYVDFTYYSTVYGGTAILADSFIKYERRARAFINDVTFNRLQNDATLIDDTVKECLCEIMERNYSIDQEEAETGGKLISSETIDQHSVTYAVSDIEKNEVDKSRINFTKFYTIARQYLGNTGLLYRGV